MQPEHEAASGFSVLELVIALGLVLIAVLAACQLIVASLLIVEGTGRSLRDPSAASVSMTLRRDIHSSSAVAAPSDEWSSDTLALRTPFDETIRFELRNDALIRVVTDQEGNERERLTLMRGIRSWRYLALTPHLIECELSFAVHADPAFASVITDPTRQGRGRIRIERFRFSLRGGSGGRAW